MIELPQLDGLFAVNYFFMTLVVAGIAQGKNLSGFTWWLAACFFTPPLALFILVAFGEHPPRKENSDAKVQPQVKEK